MMCAVCSEPIERVAGKWRHAHGDESCGCGDGSTVLPPDHEVTVFRDVAESVHCDTPSTTITTNNHPEEGQP